MKLAFICIHNSCRSQMAEALARHKAEKMGVDIEKYFPQEATLLRV